MQCRALAERASATIDLAARTWNDATSGFHSRIQDLQAVVKNACRPPLLLALQASSWQLPHRATSTSLDIRPPVSLQVDQVSDLDPSDGPATVNQELLALLALGVPTARVSDFLCHTWREADLSRALKATCAASETIIQLCVTQVAPALEMLIHKLGHLHGLAKWPHHFAVTLGLQASART